MTEYIIPVTAAIVIEGDKVFLGRRGPNVPLNGCWEFPGGKIEYWETPQECLERELFEELGVASKAGEVHNARLLTVTTHYGKSIGSYCCLCASPYSVFFTV